MAASDDESGIQPKFRLDKAFYDKVRAATPQFKLVDKFIIPAFSGSGFIVNKGQTFRVIQEEGPQVVDVAFWNNHNRKETFSSTRTWEVEGWFIKVNTRLWSQLPWFRPMATCTEDTVVPQGSDYHNQSVATHCSPELYEVLSDTPGLNACRLNLLQAIEPFGLTEEDLNDNIDVHQKFRVDTKEGMYYLSRSDGQPGTFIEFYAEMDMLVGVSVCPNGDNSTLINTVVWPVGIEIYDTGIEPQEFPQWTDWRPTWKGKWAPPRS